MLAGQRGQVQEDRVKGSCQANDIDVYMERLLKHECVRDCSCLHAQWSTLTGVLSK